MARFRQGDLGRKIVTKLRKGKKANIQPSFWIVGNRIIIIKAKFLCSSDHLQNGDQITDIHEQQSERDLKMKL